MQLLLFFFAMIFTVVYTPPKFYSDPVPQQAVCRGQFNVVSFTRQMVQSYSLCTWTKYHLSIICKFMGFLVP